MTLKEAKIGSTVTVKKINGAGALKRRIMDMGITKGAQIYIRKVAPLGDPIEITSFRFVKKTQQALRLNNPALPITNLHIFAQRLGFANYC